eukprot:COSAG05_NODE_7677_length_780_cov_2.198238_2_plen_198_part_00
MGDPLAAKKAKYHLKAMTGSEQAEVTLEQFKEWVESRQSSGSSSTAIFFMQTFAMISRETGHFGATDIVNLSVESTAGFCFMPAMTLLMGLVTVLVGPIGALLTIILEFNIAKKFKFKGCKCELPLEVKGHHWRRAVISVLVFAYAPLTRRCVELVMCIAVPYPIEGSYYLGMDMSKECWYPQPLLELFSTTPGKHE